MKKIAAKDPFEEAFKGSKDDTELKERINYYFNNTPTEKLNELAVGNCAMRRLRIDGLFLTIGLSVEPHPEDNRPIWHMSMSEIATGGSEIPLEDGRIGMMPGKVPDETAEKITKTFFPEGYEEVGPIGVVQTIRHIFAEF